MDKFKNNNNNKTADFHPKKYKTFFFCRKKSIKGHLNKWKGSPCSWIGKQYC